jgi:hypothetical protein
VNRRFLMAESKKAKAELEPLRPIVREIEKALADIRSQKKNAPADRRKTLNLRMKLLKRCQEDLFEFFMC